MRFTRMNPSPRYGELVALYRQMHLEGERFMNLPPEKVFPGLSLRPEAARIKRLIEKTGAASILSPVALVNHSESQRACRPAWCNGPVPLQSGNLSASPS